MGSALPALRVRKGASKAEHRAVAARELAQSIIQPDAALYLFYCAPGYDLRALEQAIRESFGDRLVIGCTTAGEKYGEQFNGMRRAWLSHATSL
jgi:hypothetical protein